MIIIFRFWFSLIIIGTMMATEFCFPLLGQPIKLNSEEISRQLEIIPQWTLTDQQLHRVYHFERFSQAIAFVNRVAKLAEKAEHHPDILIKYNQVSLTLTTHDAGGLTQKDFDLARQISQLQP